MGKKLYVGNLPFSVTEDALNDKFNEVGQVDSVRLILDRDSGRSKGFGFVEMGSDEEAKNAISSFDGSQWEGRAIVVNEARPMERRSFGGPRGGGGSAQGWRDDGERSSREGNRRF